MRNGNPVLRTHKAAEGIVAGLSRGFSGKLLRLYQREQAYLSRLSKTEPEPAYLLLSRNQGGFPRFGFYLDDIDKRQAGYVDLHESSRVHGRFGSMDQIFPHELGHIIMRQLAGESPGGGANQVHATGLRTDPFIAFSEGFAEHLQVMAIEDEDADESTKILARDRSWLKLTNERLERYGRELQAFWASCAPMQMGFLTWFSPAEQVMRYHHVKANAFARQAQTPVRMLERSDLYNAYLWQAILPGNGGSGLKSLPVMLSTEGVVSAFFYGFVTSSGIQQRYYGDEFYAGFGARREEISPLENIYLKVFRVFHRHRTKDTVSFVSAYRAEFPEESDLLDDIVAAAFQVRTLNTAPPVWLANDKFRTGTTLFDQFRGLPRDHTFDLNAATVFDFLTVPGMTRAVAEKIVALGPYGDLDELRTRSGIGPELYREFREMAVRMEHLKAEAVEEQSMLSIQKILMPYIWRAIGSFLVAGTAGTLLYRRVSGRRWRRAAVAGAAASLLGLMLAWLTYPGGAMTALIAPIIAFGFPAVLWEGIKKRKWREAVRLLGAWIGAAIPPALLVQPWPEFWKNFRYFG